MYCVDAAGLDAELNCAWVAWESSIELLCCDQNTADVIQGGYGHVLAAKLQAVSWDTGT